MTPEILSEPEWEHWFNLLCRADGLDGLYTAEEKLQLHERAIRADRDRLAARVADLEAFVREPVPFGAYVRWCQDGNTADADAMQAWSDARAAALGAPGGES